MFADFFIRRPVFASVCAMLIVLAGAAVIPTLPIAQFPNLAPPQVAVTSVYIGASAQTVESAVTIPLEQQINGAEGMKYMTSTSGNDGTSQITVTFDLTRNPDLATVDIQNRVNTAQGRLPSAVKNVGITTAKTSQNFVFGAAIISDNNKYSTLFMSNYLDVYVRDALKRVPGVADVIIFGERKYSMRLWLDPVRMAGRALTAPDVVNSLSEQNVEVAAGQVGQQPSMPGQQYQVSVRAVGRLSEPAQFENIILKTNADGTLVRLKDVGHSELGAENYASDLQFNGQDAVGIAVAQLSTANALDVDRRAIAELDRLSKSFPSGMQYKIAFDTTDAVGESIRDVTFTVGSAIALVILVIFIFLGDWRTTMIHFIATPVSLIGTFVFVKLLGFSINTLTLFGITLATGLVVDDAIVVIENIERHMHEGERDSRKAAAAATGEITGAVIATSLVLVAVFVPVAFFPGTTGILFRQFALTIAFSIAISAFNALTLAPVLASILLRESHEKWWWLRKFDAGVQAMTNGYRRLLGHILKHKLAMVVLFFAGLGLTYLVFLRLPTGFVPDEDQGYFIIVIQAPSGASLEYTKAIGKQVSDMLAVVPESEGTFSVAGFSFAGAAANQGLIFVPLKPYSQRKGEQHTATAIVNRVRPMLFGVQGAIVFATLPPAIQGLGQFGGFQFVVQDLAAHTLDELAGATQGLMRQAAMSHKEIVGLYTPFTANDPQYLVTIDREKAKSLHVPLSQITDTLGVYMGSAYVNDFDFNNRSYRVYVQADKQFRATAQDMKQFYVRSDTGAMVPLDNLINITQTTTPQVISHYNLFRSAEIDGSATPGYSSGQAIAAMDELAKKMPQGFSYSWTGLSLEELQAGGTSLILFGLGTLVVYLTLSAQYESFVLPFIVLLAVPMALLGALGAQWIRGLQNDVFCQVGLVMLVGLSSKNAILIVEFAEQLRH